MLYSILPSIVKHPEVAELKASDWLLWLKILFPNTMKTVVKESKTEGPRKLGLCMVNDKLDYNGVVLSIMPFADSPWQNLSIWQDDLKQGRLLITCSLRGAGIGGAVWCTYD